METTILPKKTATEVPMAVNDDAHAQLIADPTIHQFVQQPVAAPPIMVNSYAQQPISQVNSAPVLTAASPTNAASGADFVANTNTDWINNKWRPVMGWMYMAVCMTDFVVFPVLWSLLQALSKGAIASQWQPLTLQGAGLFHIAMGAVLGVAAYGRTKEKLENKA
jgi:hypothetical protein